MARRATRPLTAAQYVYTTTYMGRPRKLETLTRTITGRVRNDQWWWLNQQAERRFDGEQSRALRWALDQAQTFTWVLSESDPIQALDEILYPEKYELPPPEEQIAEAERELEEWKREQAIKRARAKKASS
jgi:hypothetical protein